MFTRKPRLRLEKFAINGAKRLLQHNQGIAEVDRRAARASHDAIDPSATLAVHCANGSDANFSPYQSTRLRR
jgi:hypothetical protein